MESTLKPQNNKCHLIDEGGSPLGQVIHIPATLFPGVIGSTQDFDSWCQGSSPWGTTNKKQQEVKLNIN